MRAFRIYSRLSFVVCILTLATFGNRCGSNWGTHVRQLINDTKKQAKASDIQAALVPFFSVTNFRDDSLGDIKIITNQLPKEIISLPIFSDDPSNLSVSYITSTNLIFILSGGGFGSWGIVVVRPGSNENPQSKTVTPWKDGVYFLNDYK